MANNPIVGIIMGSDSDLPTMEHAEAVLQAFGVPYELDIVSAHRSPERAVEYAKTANERGLKVIIAGAGAAAHLAGVTAAYTTLPVIGVPVSSGAMSGLDALYATVQMPPGVPVACMSIGGGRNAALLAVEILALSDPALAGKLDEFRREQAESVAKKSKRHGRQG